MKPCHITLPDDEQKRLVFYLAMEEYIARNIETLLPLGENGTREAFFLWQVPPTVIFGRNQVMEAEVNLDWCHQHHVQLFRRKSGGGCVYSDQGNIMLSYISDVTDVSLSFDIFLEEVADMLQQLGLDARRSGRNDILIGTRKVSGNSLFLLPHSSIVHGTLLYDTDFEALVQAITPSTAKISSKGVDSVRQHVTNVKEELENQASLSPLAKDIQLFKDYIIHFFCDRGACPICDNVTTLQLTQEDVRKIEEIEATYLDPDFLKGHQHGYTMEFSGRIDQVGEVKVEIKMEAERIDQCWLKGDVFPLQGDVDQILTDRLKGCPNDNQAVAAALEGLELEKHILHLHTTDLLRLLFPDS